MYVCVCMYVCIFAYAYLYGTGEVKGNELAGRGGMGIQLRRQHTYPVLSDSRHLGRRERRPIGTLELREEHESILGK